MRKKNKWLPKIKEYVDKNDPGAMIIPFSGAFEQKLMDLESEDEKKAYLEETKCTSVLDKIVVQGYKALQLEYFFTAGPDEVKAWTIQKGTKAPQVIVHIQIILLLCEYFFERRLVGFILTLRRDSLWLK